MQAQTLHVPFSRIMRYSAGKTLSLLLGLLIIDQSHQWTLIGRHRLECKKLFSVPCGRSHPSTFWTCGLDRKELIVPFNSSKIIKKQCTWLCSALLSLCRAEEVQACKMWCRCSWLCFLELRFVSAELSFVKLKWAWLLLWDEFETLSAEIIELLLAGGS